jgi:hypothetical protein
MIRVRRWMRWDVSRCGLHSALHYSLYARPSLRASVTAPFRTSLALPVSASGDFT